MSQIRARSPAIALQEWARKLDHNIVSGFTSKMKRELIKDAAGENPVLLDGMRNVWCKSFNLGRHLMLVHFTE